MNEQTIYEILAALALAATVYGGALELSMQLIVKPAIGFINKKVNKTIINPTHAALIVGVIMALALRIDLATGILATSGIIVPIEYVSASMIISGLFIGRMSHLIHDLWPSSTARRTNNSSTNVYNHSSIAVKRK